MVTSYINALVRPVFLSLGFQTDNMGCFFTNVTLSFSQDLRYYRDSIVAEASLLEDGTGNSGNISGKRHVKIQ